MPENERLSALVGAFTRLEKELWVFGEDTREDDALRALFVLNKEVGRAASLTPGLRSALRPFQLRLNEITVGLKHGDPKVVRDGLTGARTELERLVAARPAGN